MTSTHYTPEVYADLRVSAKVIWKDILVAEERGERADEEHADEEGGVTEDAAQVGGEENQEHCAGYQVRRYELVEGMRGGQWRGVS